MMSIMAGNNKWMLKESWLEIFFKPAIGCPPHTDRTGRTVFRRDMGTGAVGTVPGLGKTYGEIFSSCWLPYRNNPGIVEISEYKKLRSYDPW